MLKPCVKSYDICITEFTKVQSYLAQSYYAYTIKSKWDDKYLKTECTVTRRFSEFSTLSKIIQENYFELIPPEFPYPVSKEIYLPIMQMLNVVDTDIIHQRMKVISR